MAFSSSHESYTGRFRSRSRYELSKEPEIFPNGPFLLQGSRNARIQKTKKKRKRKKKKLKYGSIFYKTIVLIDYFYIHFINDNEKKKKKKRERE